MICKIWLMITPLIALGWLLLFLSNMITAEQKAPCTTLYNASDGWVFESCPTDLVITTPMNISLNGASQGQAAYIRFSHPSQNDAGRPHVVAIYASGYVRLKQNADPTPPIPFGTSFILGPAYWSDSSTYHHNPQLSNLEIDTSWLPDGPVRLTAVANNADFDIHYQLTLPTPRDRQTRLHVTQTYTATANISIDATRRAEAQGFILAQFSSMFINEGGSCDGGFTDCHDSNAIRFIGGDLVRQKVALTAVSPNTLFFSSPNPLGNSWLDLLHTDDTSWQGNTPNTRLVLDQLPTDRTITPQGWVSTTSSPHDDNVGVWLHDDGVASQSWSAGETAQIGYWLLAQDNPPAPWDDLDLRAGLTLLDFEGEYDCEFVKDAGQLTTGSLAPISGYNDTAVQLTYDLGSGDGNWAQIRCNFDPPFDFSPYDHFRVEWRGDPSAANSLEVGLINPNGGEERIFGRGYHHATQRAWWGQLIVPFSFLHPWTENSEFDPSQVSAIFISIVKDPVDDVGRNGRFAIDNLAAFNVISRTVPTQFEMVTGHVTATETAVNWLINQQRASGFLKSWPEDAGICQAHIYDQALALLAFIHEERWREAEAIIDGLEEAQNSDGSWYKAYDCDADPLTDVSSSNKWEGDVAWAIYALSRYLTQGGAHPQAAAIRNNAADWLASRLDSDTGCLVIDHTEGTVDAWWAFHSAWPAYTEEANGLQSCLLIHYWDENMGRFKGGQAWQQPYLDNQTWGAAFLKAIGRGEDARRALSYAYETMLLPAQGGQGYGLDGQGGPWSEWNEGVGQYIAVGGDGANDLLAELLAQQRADGAMPGSFDEFSGGGVWTTRMHGVAPTAWLIFALSNEPFHPAFTSIYLPFIKQNSG